MPYFNPTLVRFKLEKQINSIVSDVKNFNPTLVRFKLGGEAKDGRVHHHFNPTLVRFKRYLFIHDEVAYDNFNPTLVRFKPISPPVIAGSISSFQSYISAI